MSQTDRQTDKDRETKWSLTVQEGQWHLLDVMPEIVAEWGWQEEIAPTTGSKHRQCYVRTKRQVRFAQMKKTFPGVHIEMALEWSKLVNYCKKTDTAVPNTQIHQLAPVNTAKTMAQVLVQICSHLPYHEPMTMDMTPKQIEERLSSDYRHACEEILMENPNLVGLLGLQLYERNFKLFKKVFSHFAIAEIESQTDRQTDIELDAPAFQD